MASKMGKFLVGSFPVALLPWQFLLGLCRFHLSLQPGGCSACTRTLCAQEPSSLYPVWENQISMLWAVLRLATPQPHFPPSLLPSFWLPSRFFLPCQQQWLWEYTYPTCICSVLTIWHCSEWQHMFCSAHQCAKLSQWTAARFSKCWSGAKRKEFYLSLTTHRG